MLRTWQWTTAAPASAASSAALAIWLGVTGIAGCLPTVSPAPVTAQVMITLGFIVSSSLWGKVSLPPAGDLTFSVWNLIISDMRRRDLVFLLIPRFSMIALFSALEPLRVANRFAGPIFSWRFASVDGKPATASNGIPVSVTIALGGIGRPDGVV